MPNPSTPDYYLYYYMSIDALATPSMLNRVSKGRQKRTPWLSSARVLDFSSSTSKNKLRIEDLFFFKKTNPGRIFCFFELGATRRKIVDIASPVHRLHTVNRWRLTTKKKFVVRTSLSHTDWSHRQVCASNDTREDPPRAPEKNYMGLRRNSIRPLKKPKWILGQILLRKASTLP